MSVRFPDMFDRRSAPPDIDPEAKNLHDEAMPDMNREEVKARLEASEARVAASHEAIKGEFTALKGEFAGLRHEMASGLDRILLAVEKGKSDRYATGYKVITWSIGTVFTLVALGLALYKTFVLHG